MTEQREITKEYFKVLEDKKGRLLEVTQTVSGQAFVDVFDHIIQINRIQLGLLPQMYPDVYRRIKK